jgi:hypothetical protein
MTSTAIASRLGISPRMVDYKLHMVFVKTGVASRLELVVWIRDHGYLRKLTPLAKEITLKEIGERLRMRRR